MRLIYISVIFSFLTLVHAGNRPVQMADAYPQGQEIPQDEFEDDGYGEDDADGYDESEEDQQMDDSSVNQGQMPMAPNMQEQSMMPSRQEDVTEEMDMAPTAPEMNTEGRSGMQISGGQSQSPERLESGRPVQITPEAPMPRVVPQTPLNAPYAEGELLSRREHPPVQKEVEFGQTDWNQIDLHSLTRQRVDRF